MPSGAELLRQVKSQIEEVDPSEVAELMHEGVAIIDVRETEEYATGHLPGAKHVPQREAPDATMKAVAEFIKLVIDSSAQPPLIPA